MEEAYETCVGEEGNAETFGVLEFILLGDVVSGKECSHDQK